MRKSFEKKVLVTWEKQVRVGKCFSWILVVWPVFLCSEFIWRKMISLWYIALYDVDNHISIQALCGTIEIRMLCSTRYEVTCLATSKTILSSSLALVFYQITFINRSLMIFLRCVIMTSVRRWYETTQRFIATQLHTAVHDTNRLVLKIFNLIEVQSLILSGRAYGYWVRL